MTTPKGVALAEAARVERATAQEAAQIATLDAERGESLDLTPVEHDAAGGHDRTNHDEEEPELDARHLSKVQGHVTSLMPTKAQLERMTLEQQAKCMRLVTSLAMGCHVKEIGEAACVARAYAFSPASDAESLLDEAAVLQGTNVYNAKKQRLTQAIVDYAAREEIDLDEVADDFNEDDYPTLKTMRKRRRELVMAPVAICERVTEIVKQVNEWTPGKGAATCYTRLTHGNELLLILAHKAGLSALPSAARRTKLCLGEWPAWIEFKEQMLEYQAAELRAGLRSDPPWITPTIAKGWIRGKYKDFSVYGAAGPGVARAAIKNWLGNPKFVPSFDAVDPKRLDKNGNPMRMFTLEHIDDCSEEVSNAERAGFLCIGANNPYGFGIFPDAFNNSDIMKDNSMSTAKRAFWTVRVCKLARSSKQELTMELAGYGAREIARQYKSGVRTYKRKALPATAATRAAHANLANCPFQAKLEAIKALQVEAKGSGGGEGSSSMVDEGVTSETASAAEEIEDSSESDQEILPDDDGASTPPGPPPPPAAERSNAAGKRPMAPASEPAVADKRPRTDAADESEEEEEEEAMAPPFELVKKTKAEYKATLTKLGVDKVCEKKYRRTGSEEPFTMCETTTGVSKNSTCRTCQTERQGKPARGEGGRNCCPCKANGGSCTHGRGHKAAGYRCAVCRDGKCTPEYHASGKHFRQPPSTNAPSTAAKPK